MPVYALYQTRHSMSEKNDTMAVFRLLYIDDFPISILRSAMTDESFVCFELCYYSLNLPKSDIERSSK